MTYEMLTGQLPFYNISRSETIKNILNVNCCLNIGLTKENQLPSRYVSEGPKLY